MGDHRKGHIQTLFTVTEWKSYNTACVYFQFWMPPEKMYLIKVFRYDNYIALQGKIWKLNVGLETWILIC